MPRVLICASNIVHLRNFHLPYIRYFKEQGFEVHVAVPGGGVLENVDVLHDVPIKKRFVSLKNLSAAGQIGRLVRSGRFDLIVVHTTLAAFVVRLGVLFAGKNKPPLVNTVHGYFFWDGCGFLRRLIYYPPERLLRSVTDCIVTMNDEDTRAARKLVKKGGSVVQVHGMGADTARFHPPDGAEKRRARQALDIPGGAYVIVYPAEFSKRKNHIELLRALDEVRKKTPGVLLLLCGTGALEDALRREIADRGLGGHVRFLGWRGDMENIYAAADMAVSTSESEGLPFNILEAQLCALPVAAGRIRGHTDLIGDGKTGFLYTPGDSGQLAEIILRVIRCPGEFKAIGQAARQSAMRFSLDTALEENVKAYRQALGEQ